MKSTIKNVLRRLGLYSAARSVFRRLSASHRTERRLRQRFFSEFIKPDDLCFDIGSNLGQSVEAFLANGARVVALEPNPMCIPTLMYHYASNRRVTLVQKAVGRTPGVAELHFSGTAATASLRGDWNSGDDQRVAVEITTLEQLIALHGTPQLLKVDVEGLETEVFAGLEHSIPTVYFEMHRDEPDSVRIILTRLASLGAISGVNAISEDHGTWLLENWVAPGEFLSKLGELPRVANVIVRSGK